VGTTRVPDGTSDGEISNPEENRSFNDGFSALADKTNADIVVGTDPDCDRLGVAVRDNDGKMTVKSTMVLMTAFLEQWEKSGKNKWYNNL
jgi:phosphomannomutase